MLTANRWQSAGTLALAGSVLLWLALPPVGAWWLGWLAPLPWLALVTRESSGSPPTGRWRAYRDVWIASSIFWLVYLQGVRKAHPALYLGWIALSLYLAVYLPTFLALTRVAVLRLRWPLPLAASLVWMLLELVRGRLLSGFTGGMLAHTQSSAVPMIQVVDLGGAYLLSGLMMAAAACAWEAIRALRSTDPDRQASTRKRCVAYAATALTLPLLIAGYGAWRLNSSPVQNRASTSAPLRVALIQESIDTIFEYNEQRNADAFERYLRRSLEACQGDQPLAAIVWPESMFTENSPELLFETSAEVPPQLQVRRRVFERKAQFAAGMIRDAHQQRHGGGQTEKAPNSDGAEAALQSSPAATSESSATATPESADGLRSHKPSPHPAADSPPPPPVLIAGTVTVAFDTRAVREYNSALFITPEGQVAHRYYKRHLVMFGEYIPLGGWFPWIYSLVGMPGDLRPGDEEQVFPVQGWRLAPSVCFESLVPHHMREKLVELDRRGEPADVQVNLTNDGWFWGSSLLDMHLQAGIYRAVELRRPFIVAANTGISAWVDSDGRVRLRAGKQQGATLIAELERDDRRSIYQQLGDVPLWGLVIAAALLAVWQSRKPQGKLAS